MSKSEIITTVCAFLLAYSCHYFTWKPASEAIHETIEPVPISAENDVMVSTILDEMEHALPPEFQSWALPEHEYVFWGGFAFLVLIFIGAPIYFLMYGQCRRVTHGKNKQTKQKKCKVLVPKRNEVDLAETMKTRRDERRRRFQNIQDTIPVICKEMVQDGSHLSKIRVGPNASPAVGKDSRTSSNRGIARQDGKPKKTLMAPSKAKDRKDKVQVGLAPTPNIKAATSKVRCWNKTSHSTNESRVKHIRDYKVDYSKIKAKVCTGEIGGDKQRRQKGHRQ
jgi:hypothetical protein